MDQVMCLRKSDDDDDNTENESHSEFDPKLQGK
jgi:hypothetical protein